MSRIAIVGVGLLWAMPLWAQEEDRNARIATLIQDLGADDFKTREAAEQELRTIGAAAIPQLKQVLEDKDAERADRARRILADLEKKEERPADSEKPQKKPAIRKGIRSVYHDLSRGLTITVEDGKFEVTAPEVDKESGKKVYKVYSATSLEEFKEKYPEITKQFDIEHAVPQRDADPWKDLRERFALPPPRDWTVPFDENFEKFFEEQRKLLDELRRRGPWRRSPDDREGPSEDRGTPSSRGTFGIRVQPVDETLAAQLDLKEGEGIQIEEVTAGSLAEKAGLKKHDVVVSIDGKPVTDKWEFRRAVRGGLDKGFKLEIFRGGKRETVEHKP